MTLLLLLTLICVITYTIEIIFGLAGTILMITIMSHFYETKTLVIFSILPQILVGSIGLIRSPRTVSLTYLFGMLGFAALGGILGLYLFYQFPSELFHRLLAGTIVIFGLYLVIGPKRVRLGQLTQRVLDTVAGASQALFGISGPIAMTRLLGSFDDKLVIRNYALAFFLSLNIFRASGYLINHTITPDIVEMMLISGPFLVVALWYSNHLHFKVDQQTFRRVVSWMILLGGIMMFFNV